MGFISRFLPIRQGDPLVKKEDPSTLPYPPESSILEARASLGPNSNGASLPQHYTQITQTLQSSLPSACRWLSSDIIKLVGRHPVAAGGFADIWEGTYDGREVVLKSYRCYMSFDVSQIFLVCCNGSLREVVLMRCRRGSATKFAYATCSTMRMWT